MSPLEFRKRGIVDSVFMAYLLFFEGMYHNVVVNGTTRAQAMSTRILFSYLLKQMGIARDATLVVHFVSPQTMRAIHYNCKGRDYATDVLTFKGSGSMTEANSIVPVVTRVEALDLGDIFICPLFMRERLRRLPTATLPLTTYFIAATVHAFLHSLGYDHDTPETHAAMSILEKHLSRKVWRNRRTLDVRLPMLDG
jgi:rRNA maturation RNase YbeY